ncbi:MAG: GNAT family N-acetyltransferase [Clostridium sp.]|nr:GNAT family N-acetyltransferase [Clostridium sp.]
MKENDFFIRVATKEDAGELLAVYTPYVTGTVISFECEVPGILEFQRRIQNTLKKYPYLLAEKNGEILGYTYTGPFVGRAAYNWAAETTIYLKEDKKKIGIGRALYEALEKVSKAQNILNLNACIGYPEVEDEYLTKNSVQFHEHMGYRMVGEFHKCGYKFGRWYNMVWMEKMLGKHVERPEEVIPFSELTRETLVGAGIRV